MKSSGQPRQWTLRSQPPPTTTTTTTTATSLDIAATAAVKTLEQQQQHPMLIAYASQGPAAKYRVLYERFENSFPNGTWVLFYHSFDEPCEGCLFRANTTFAQGKNLVIKAVIQSSYYLNLQIKYIVSHDDDVILFRGSGGSNLMEDGWVPFHNLLLHNETTFPLIKPAYATEENYITYQSCVDEIMWAIRPDHLALIYPFNTHVLPDFYWFNALKLHMVMDRCYPNGYMVIPHVRIINPSHRYNNDAPIYHDWNTTTSMVAQVMEQEFPSLGKWIWSFPKGIIQRCNVKKAPSFGIHPICQIAFQQRFDDWMAGKIEP